MESFLLLCWLQRQPKKRKVLKEPFLLILPLLIKTENADKSSFYKLITLIYMEGSKETEWVWMLF